MKGCVLKGQATILVTVLLLRRDTMTKAKESVSLRFAYRFRGLVHDHCGREHGSGHSQA